MRREILFAGAIGATVVASLVVVLAPGPAAIGRRSGAGPEAGTDAGVRAGVPGERTVDYQGVRIPVPDGWPVYLLDRDPRRCVRFDRRALYLGRPGPQPDCPARLVGRSEALHVAPLDPAARASPADAVTDDALAGYTVRDETDGEVRLRLPEAGVEMTGSYGSAPAVLQELLRGIRVGAYPPAGRARDVSSPGPRAAPAALPAPPAPVRGRAVALTKTETGTKRGTETETAVAVAGTTPRRPLRPASGTGRPRQRPWVVGYGFDTCTAPSLEAMRAWQGVYEVANIYIGGAARGCAQPQLTAPWVRAVRDMGYRLIPTYVGLQAPCTAYRTTFHHRNAGLEGRRAATDAIRQARALGIPRRKPIYFDLEAYDTKRAKCRDAVLRFVHSWSKRMRAKRYTSGVYSSVGSGILDIGRAVGIIKPKAVWFAHWDGKAQVHGSPYLPDSWWTPHRRIKQYRGGHHETHNGVTINIDSNVLDGRVF